MSNPLPDVIHVDDIEKYFGPIKQNNTSFEDLMNSVPDGEKPELTDDHREINALMNETFKKIEEYQKQIDTAETEAKKDLYRRKINNAMAKLQQTAANKAAAAQANEQKLQSE